MSSLAVGEQYLNAVAPCIESHKRYAAKHRFAYHLLKDAPLRFDRPLPWLKLPLLLHLLRSGTEQILFVDADAMITNLEVSPSQHFDAMKRAGA